MTRNKLHGFLRLFRFELPFFAGMMTILGEVLALGRFPSVHETILGFLSVFFISASALILNDYFDIETDRINSPARPLPAGQVTEREVVGLAILVMAVGFLASYLISKATFFVAILIWGIGFLYNWRLKRTGIWGNLLVSLSVGMTFIYGGLVVGKPFEIVVWFFALIAMLVDLGEEIAADAVDVAGDKAAGSRSLAIIWGQDMALRISQAIFMVIVLISMGPFIFRWLSWIYFLPLLLADIIILFGTLKLKAAQAEQTKSYIRIIYVGVSLAMILFLAMRLMLV